MSDAGEAEYTVAPGALDSTKQESTLEISPDGLARLETTTTFTCIVKSGEYPDNSPEVTKTLEMTKLTYGTNYLRNV